MGIDNNTAMRTFERRLKVDIEKKYLNKEMYTEGNKSQKRVRMTMSI